ncbi:MAG: PIN domain-containing protein [Endozoicomonas sp.]
MISVDTNVLLRYLLEPRDSRNPSWQTDQARQVIDRADSVYITDVVLAELEWVLESVFELQKTQIHSLIQTLSCNTRFQFEDWEALQCALIDYREYPSVDFSDCLIARRAHNKGSVTLYSFEKVSKLGALPVVTTLCETH